MHILNNRGIVSYSPRAVLQSFKATREKPTVRQHREKWFPIDKWVTCFFHCFQRGIHISEFQPIKSTGMNKEWGMSSRWVENANHQELKKNYRRGGHDDRMHNIQAVTKYRTIVLSHLLACGNGNHFKSDFNFNTLNQIHPRLGCFSSYKMWREWLFSRFQVLHCKQPTISASLI